MALAMTTPGTSRITCAGEENTSPGGISSSAEGAGKPTCHMVSLCLWRAATSAGSREQWDRPNGVDGLSCPGAWRS